MEETLFPYSEVRPSQDKFIRDVQACLTEKKHLLAHVPTGVGKSAATLAPALAYCLKEKKTLFFVTPMHTQHQIAIDTLRLIKERHKQPFLVVDLIGKKWMCLQEGAQAMTSSEFSDYCQDMVEKERCDYYTRMGSHKKPSFAAQKALRELEEQNPLPVEALCQEAAHARLCPYELSVALGKKANVIIGDYFHILSPSVRDNLFKKIEKDLGDVVVIFDEAHNLGSKSRDLLSMSLSTLLLDAAIKETEGLGFKEMAEDLEVLKDALGRLVKQKTSVEVSEALVGKAEFLEQLKGLDREEFIGNLLFVAEQALEVKKRSFTKGVAHFLEAWTGPDEGFARILTTGFSRQGKGMSTLSYRCLDPSFVLRPLADAAQLIGMSGTLMPLPMYKDLYGFPAETREYEDPFPQENRMHLIIPRTTTKFTKRDPEMFQKIAILCSKVVNAVPGNSLVFFPSYTLRDEVNRHLQSLCEKTTFVEHPGMSKEDRMGLLERFKSYEKSGAVLLAASSGSFGEGIDLPGDLLKAVVIVGLPLSKPDLETQELIRYYDQRFQKGWDYGYLYPAILRTIQNAGRCIRSTTDKGVIVFLDERYAWPQYRRCFPKGWNLRQSERPISLIEEFFRRAGPGQQSSPAPALSGPPASAGSDPAASPARPW